MQLKLLKSVCLVSHLQVCPCITFWAVSLYVPICLSIYLSACLPDKQPCLLRGRLSLSFWVQHLAQLVMRRYTVSYSILSGDKLTWKGVNRGVGQDPVHTVL